jgi:hypothetical protein
VSLLPVGEIAVPRLALKHPHVQMASALATVFSADPERVERIIGTENGRKGAPIPDCQLYGWGPNVKRHDDRTGFVYFTPLLVRHSRVYAVDWRRRERATSVLLERGTVYRLYDFADHWTRDSAPVVCAFAGPMPFPQDRVAITRLQEGINALARGDRRAPHVKRAFQIPLRGQCWADTPDGTDVVLIEEAKREGWLIARCALCERFAVRVDQYFPYQHELSRCAVHLRQRESVALEPEAA